MRRGQLPALAATAVLLASVTGAVAQVPIQSDTALQPQLGGVIVRQQVRASTASDDPGPLGLEIHGRATPLTVAYGVREDVTLIATATWIEQRIRSRTGGTTTRVDGLGDTTLLGKFRVHREDDGPLRSSRGAFLAGLVLPTGERGLTGDSYDPVLGGVYSRIVDRDSWHADLLVSADTGGVRPAGATVRYDLAYIRRLRPARFAEQTASALHGLLELNGRYLTNGDHELLLAPGVQLAGRRFVFEASVQLPVWQENDHSLETDHGVTLSWRFRF